jgi:hypothetical protein
VHNGSPPACHGEEKWRSGAYAHFLAPFQYLIACLARLKVRLVLYAISTLSRIRKPYPTALSDTEWFLLRSCGR